MYRSYGQLYLTKSSSISFYFNKINDNDDYSIKNMNIDLSYIQSNELKDFLFVYRLNRLWQENL